MPYGKIPTSLAMRIGLSDKTFVIVHQFQAPSSSERIWYDRWGGPQLSFLIDGLEGFGIEYKVVDVETALVSSKTVFSDVDYAISLVCGNLNIALWAAVPAVAEWYGAAAVPTSADTAIVGERKDVANLVASRVGLPVPTWSYPFEALQSVSRTYWLLKPRDYGNSYGVKIDKIDELQKQKPPYFALYQEFFDGYDCTIGVLWNFEKHKFEFLYPRILIPSDHSETWLYDEQAKRENDEQGHPQGTKVLYADLPESLRARLSDLCYAIGNTSLARIDLRVRVRQDHLSDNVEISDYAFLEINPFPSISEASSFGRAFRYTVENSDIVFDNFRLDMEYVESKQLCKMLTVCALIGSTRRDLGAFTSTENA